MVFSPRFQGTVNPVTFGRMPAGKLCAVRAGNNIKRFAGAKRYTGQDTPGEPEDHPRVDERHRSSEAIET